MFRNLEMASKNSIPFCPFQKCKQENGRIFLTTRTPYVKVEITLDLSPPISPLSTHPPHPPHDYTFRKTYSLFQSSRALIGYTNLEI